MKKILYDIKERGYCELYKGMKKILGNTKGMSYIEVLIAGAIMLVILLATAAIISNSVSVNVNLIKSKEAISQMTNIFSDVKRATNQIVSSYPQPTLAEAINAQPHHLHVVLYNPILYNNTERFQTYRFALVVHDQNHYVVPGGNININLIATSPRVSFDLDGNGNYNTQETSSTAHPEWNSFPAVRGTDNNYLRGGIRIFGIKTDNQGTFLRPGLRIDTNGGPFTFKILAWAQIQIGPNIITITNFQADNIEYLVLPSEVTITQTQQSGATQLSGKETRQYIRGDKLDFDDLRRDEGYLTWDVTHDNTGDGLPDDLDIQLVETKVRWEGMSGTRSGNVMITPVVEDRIINTSLQRYGEILLKIEENLYQQGLINESPTHITLHEFIINYINERENLNNIRAYIQAQDVGNISPHAKEVLLKYLSP